MLEFAVGFMESRLVDGCVINKLRALSFFRLQRGLLFLRLLLKFFDLALELPLEVMALLFAVLLLVLGIGKVSIRLLELPLEATTLLFDVVLLIRRDDALFCIRLELPLQLLALPFSGAPCGRLRLERLLCCLKLVLQPSALFFRLALSI